MSAGDARRDAAEGRDAPGGPAPYEEAPPDGADAGPPRPHTHEPTHTHAGNGTVNHGPADPGPTPGDTPTDHLPGPPAATPDDDPTSEGPDPDDSGPESPPAADGTAPAVPAADGTAPVAPVPEGPGPEGAGGTSGDRAPIALVPAPRAADGEEPDALGGDEAALRGLLHQAVREVAPRDGTLEHLRRAVPARRARKRQAAVGLAAAALFLGTAVPALVHVSSAGGLGADPSVAGSASQAQGGATQGTDPAGGRGGTAGTGGPAEGEHGTGPARTPDDAETGAAAGSPDAADPSAGGDADSGACTAGRLGPAVASSSAPDSTGAVYGTFRVTNVSAAGCTVAGPGSLSVSALGAADAGRIGTARHTAGDAAAALPDPSLEAASLTLAPGSSYEVRFAWVPSETCPSTGGTPGGASPDPTPSEDVATNSGGSTGGDTDPQTQLVTEDAPADAGVAVTYAPEGGSGAATATVSHACAGTVYWTGVLPASS
ncbi:hypothetical protein [Streptomyces sp. NRRL F-5065]|uniref:hypothetical protein n=1 Tax=Streptomyces sp. NRRL F-5065 TaxID=1463855 RepID=UPI0004BF6CFD|nr:hypothetical protein [Streptomyces sp. NRRL F-5065]